MAEQLGALNTALKAESDIAIVFGSEITGAAIAQLIAYGSTLGGHVRYMALGDYANSRGAADMGMLPDRLPGYAYLDNTAAAESLERAWGAKISPQGWVDRSANGGSGTVWQVEGAVRGWR